MKNKESKTQSIRLSNIRCVASRDFNKKGLIGIFLRKKIPTQVFLNRVNYEIKKQRN